MYLQNYIKIHELGYLICCEKYYTIITSAKYCHRESLITPPPSRLHIPSIS